MLQSECITDQEKTVVFRKDKANDNIIALFPLVPSAIKSGECYAFTCPDPHKVLNTVLYDKSKTPQEQFSPWGSLEYDEVIAHTVPAIEKEYEVYIQLISALGHEVEVKAHEELMPPSAIDLGFHTRDMLISSNFATMHR